MLRRLPISGGCDEDAVRSDELSVLAKTLLLSPLASPSRPRSATRAKLGGPRRVGIRTLTLKPTYSVLSRPRAPLRAPPPRTPRHRLGTAIIPPHTRAAPARAPGPRNFCAGAQQEVAMAFRDFFL